LGPFKAKKIALFFSLELACLPLIFKYVINVENVYNPVKIVSSKLLFDPSWKICQQNELKFEGEMQKNLHVGSWQTCGEYLV
jgi:hypothetical protein